MNMDRTVKTMPRKPAFRTGSPAASPGRPSRREVTGGLLAGALLAGAGLPAPGASANSPLLLRAAMADLAAGDGVIQAAAFNGSAAGPMIEALLGEPLTLRFENALDFPLRFRMQGLRGRAVDGTSEALPPGERRQITVTPPDTGTFVYAASAADASGGHRAALLSGALIVTAQQPRIADRDLVLAVNTLVLTGAEGPARHSLVNGAPEMAVTASPGERLRLRLANLAQDSICAVRLPAGCTVIAVDGQPCEPFPPFDDVTVLAPLGRMDVVVTVSRDAAAPLLVADALADGHVYARISPEGAPMLDRYLAPRLPENNGLPGTIPFAKAVRATLKLPAVPDGPLLSAAPGASAVLTIENDGTPRAVALEGHAARLLDRLDDGWKGWWQDTLILPANETMRIAFVAEAAGRYALDIVALEGDPDHRRTFIAVG